MHDINHFQTRTINSGSLRLVIEDTPSRYEVSEAIAINGIQEGPFSLDIDSAENKTEGEVQALYGRIMKMQSSLSVGKIGLAGLAAIVGTSVVQSAEVNAWVRIKNIAQLPSLHVELVSWWGDPYQKFKIRYRRLKVTEISFSLGQDDFAKLEFSFNGEFSAYPINGNEEMLSVGVDDTGSYALRSYLPARQNLPLWMFSHTGVFWSNNTSGYIFDDVRRGTVFGNVFNEGSASIAVTLAPGAVYTLEVTGYQGTSYGRLDFLCDGHALGSLDFYHASLTERVEKSLAFIAPPGSSKKTLMISAGGITSGTNGSIILANLEISSSEQISQNVLPQRLESRHDIPVSIFDRSSAGGSATFINASDGGEALEKNGVGNEFKFELWLEPGTYSILSKVAYSADGAIQSYYIDGVLLGTIDTYFASTNYPRALSVPGTFEIEGAGRLVEISVLASTKNVSSSGFRSHIGWMSIDRAAASVNCEGIVGPSIHVLEPISASSNGFTHAADAGNWGSRYYYTVAANTVCEWQNVRLVPGRWRASLLVSRASRDLELRFDGVAETTFSPNMVADIKEALRYEWDQVDDALVDVSLRSVETGSASFNYVVLQRIG